MGKFTSLEFCHLTRSWSMDERAALAHFLEPRKLVSGECLNEIRSTDRALFIIEEGQIETQLDHVKIQLEPGESFGELSLLYETTKLANVSALKESFLWKLSIDKWIQMKRVTPTVALKLSESIVQKFARILNELPPPLRANTAVNSK